MCTGSIVKSAKQVMKAVVAAVVGGQERRPVPAPTQWIRAIHRCWTSGPQQRRAQCRVGLAPASVSASLFTTGWVAPQRADIESVHPKLSAPTVRSARPAKSCRLRSHPASPGEWVIWFKEPGKRSNVRNLGENVANGFPIGVVDACAHAIRSWYQSACRVSSRTVRVAYLEKQTRRKRSWY